MVAIYMKRALVAAAIAGSLALGGCVVAPYPRYAVYAPGYYHPHYWWR